MVVGNNAYPKYLAYMLDHTDNVITPHRHIQTIDKLPVLINHDVYSSDIYIYVYLIYNDVVTRV